MPEATSAPAVGGRGDLGVFGRLVGQPAAVHQLRRAAADPAGNAHSWLITGPPGSGRTLAAWAFAAALECPDAGCGHCRSCQAVAAGTHPDVLRVAPEGLSLGVGEARALVSQVAAAPVSGPRRVICVEEADRLTEGAAAALLKPLEEPPEGVVFLLCAPSPLDLPVTIRSRCRALALREPASDDVARLLEAEGVDPAMAAFAARAAGGHVGRARHLATDESARTRRAEVLALPTRLRSVAAAWTAAADLLEAVTREAGLAAAARDKAETARARTALGAPAGGRAPRGTAGALKELERTQRSRATRTQRDALDLALVDLAGLYRDVLVRQLGTGLAPVHPDQASTVDALAARGGPAATLSRLEAVLATREAVAGNVAPLLALEVLALALR